MKNLYNETLEAFKVRNLNRLKLLISQTVRISRLKHYNDEIQVIILTTGFLGPCEWLLQQEFINQPELQLNSIYLILNVASLEFNHMSCRPFTPQLLLSLIDTLRSGDLLIITNAILAIRNICNNDKFYCKRLLGSNIVGVLLETVDPLDNKPMDLIRDYSRLLSTLCKFYKDHECFRVVIGLK